MAITLARSQRQSHLPGCPWATQPDLSRASANSPVLYQIRSTACKSRSHIFPEFQANGPPDSAIRLPRHGPGRRAFLALRQSAVNTYLISVFPVIPEWE